MHRSWWQWVFDDWKKRHECHWMKKYRNRVLTWYLMKEQSIDCYVTKWNCELRTKVRVVTVCKARRGEARVPYLYLPLLVWTTQCFLPVGRRGMLDPRLPSHVNLRPAMQRTGQRHQRHLRSDLTFALHNLIFKFSIWLTHLSPWTLLPSLPVSKRVTSLWEKNKETVFTLISLKRYVWNDSIHSCSSFFLQHNSNTTATYFFISLYFICIFICICICNCI